LCLALYNILFLKMNEVKTLCRDIVMKVSYVQFSEFFPWALLRHIKNMQSMGDNK